jgi:hypothetical protein
MKVLFYAFSLLASLFPETAVGATDLIKVRDSTSGAPAQSTIDFSFLKKDQPMETDPGGNIKLPPPAHDKPDPMTVCPKEGTLYGGCFRDVFPAAEGTVWLVTQTGRSKLEKEGENMGEMGNFKAAAALLAMASDFLKETNRARSDELLQTAYRFLARYYKAKAMATVVPPEDLRRAVREDKAVPIKPAAEGRWDSLDFLRIAGLTRTEALKMVGLVRDR